MNPATLCRANVLERGLGWFSVSLARRSFHLDRTRINRFPEFGQLLEPIRARESIVLGSSKALALDGKPNLQRPWADEPQRYGFIRIASRTIEQVDVPLFGILAGSIQQTRGEAGVCLCFDATWNVRCGGREGGPPLKSRVSIPRYTVARPFSGPVIS